MKTLTVWCVRAIGNFILHTIFRIIEFWCVRAELPPGQLQAFFTSEYSSVRIWCVLQWHFYIFFLKYMFRRGRKLCMNAPEEGSLYFWSVKFFRVLHERTRYWNNVFWCAIFPARPRAHAGRSAVQEPAARRAPARHRKSKILNRSLHKYEYMFEIGISSLFFPQIFFFFFCEIMWPVIE